MATTSLQAPNPALPISSPIRPIRHILSRLWSVVLSLIIGEFFKGAYRVWDPTRGWSTSFTLIACALFLAKQVIDLSLFYKHPIPERPNPYDPPIANEGRWATLMRCFAENTQELFVFFFIYGSIQELNAANVLKTVGIASHLTRAAGSGLLLSIAIVEFSWLLWDLMYLGKRLDILRSIWIKGELGQRWAAIRRGGPVDRLVLRWSLLNSGFALLFLVLWGFFRYVHYWPHWVQDESIPSVGVAFRCLLLPVMLYFFIYHAALRDYYLENDFIKP
jgi:hypothetical protein